MLDIGPHLLDLLEAGLGEIVAVQATGDPLGWVSVNLHRTRPGATSSGVDVLHRRDRTGRTEVEVYSPAGVAFYDARAVDHDARADRIRTDLVAVAGGADASGERGPGAAPPAPDRRHRGATPRVSRATMGR